MRSASRFLRQLFGEEDAQRGFRRLATRLRRRRPAPPRSRRFGMRTRARSGSRARRVRAG
jgi:hypothetical protein